MPAERRMLDRVPLACGYTARIMAIDGTWQRDCRIGDVSDIGAKLTLLGSTAGLDVREFFLMLSATGNAHRRCERIWVQGDEIGVRFLREGSGKSRDEWDRADDASRSIGLVD